MCVKLEIEMREFVVGFLCDDDKNWLEQAAGLIRTYLIREKLEAKIFMKSWRRTERWYFPSLTGAMWC